MSSSNGFKISKKGILKECTQSKLKSKEIIIPDEVTEIDDKVFWCGYFTSVTIPDTVTKISDCSFKYCDDVERIVASSDNYKAVWKQMSPEVKLKIALRCLSDGDTNKCVADFIKRKSDDIFNVVCKNDNLQATVNFFNIISAPKLHVLDKYILEASEYPMVTAFLLDYKSKNFTRKYLEKVEKEDVEKEFGFMERTLEDWRKLYTISIKNNAATISKYKGNDTVIEIPQKIGDTAVKTIGEKCFYNNTHIKKVSIPEGITSIEHGAFNGCAELSEIIQPYSLEESSSRAFFNCINLKKVVFSNKLQFINNAEFRGCRWLEEIYLPDSIERFYPESFRECKNLRRADIPYGTKFIGESAFNGCESLEKIVIPNTVDMLFVYAFRDCKSASEIVLSANIKEIHEGAFWGCSSVKMIKLHEGIRNIYQWAFRDCKNLEEIKIPSSCKEIGNGAFKNCKQLSKVVIPSEVTNISPYAFENCKKLTIYGVAGSYAETYAKENNIPFIAE